MIHKGSVKDIYQHSDRELLFKFSDRYSIFDWGQMPDAIPGKGAALAEMGDKLLRYLGEQGIKTHYVGKGPAPEDLIVRSVKVPRDGVRIYASRPSSILIPLEVIYRFGVPKGSSLIKKGFKEGEEFLEPKIDFTTKLERIDRPLSQLEAREIAGMDEQEFASLLSATQSIAKKLKSVFENAGLKLWDGKIEFAFDEHRQIMLVDSIGLDEIRLTFEGKTLSKELLRQSYLPTPWYQALVEAKEKVGAEFRRFCEEAGAVPGQLPPETIRSISRIYQIASQLILNSDRNEVLALQKELSAHLQDFGRTV